MDPNELIVQRLQAALGQCQFENIRMGALLDLANSELAQMKAAQAAEAEKPAASPDPPANVG